VLTQTDLYLLGTELTLHPILTNSHNSFHLVFNIQTGVYFSSPLPPTPWTVAWAHILVRQVKRADIVLQTGTETCHSHKRISLRRSRE
jgi:hypothetical protein